MRRESADFPGASCDKTKDGKDRRRCWYVNSLALSWGTNNDGNKQRDTQNMLNMQNMQNNMYKICNEYVNKYAEYVK